MASKLPTFGEPGTIQGALDADQCPRCLVAFREPKKNGVVHCLACNLTITDNFARKRQRFDVLFPRIAYYSNKVRSKLCNQRRK
jgi:hypothetical protein